MACMVIKLGIQIGTKTLSRCIHRVIQNQLSSESGPEKLDFNVSVSNLYKLVRLCNSLHHLNKDDHLQAMDLVYIAPLIVALVTDFACYILPRSSLSRCRQQGFGHRRPSLWIFLSLSSALVLCVTLRIMSRPGADQGNAGNTIPSLHTGQHGDVCGYQNTREYLANKILV